MTEAVVEETIAPPSLTQKVAAEAVGTFVLVFIGCGAAVLTGADVVATGFAFGIAIVMMAYTFGRVSGGHFNPAVSVGAAIAGRIAWTEAGIYAAAQVVGALVGGLALAITTAACDIGWSFGEPLGSNSFGDNGNVAWAGAFLIELLLTFIFLVVILGVTDERNDTVAFAPLAIGLSLAAIHFVGINATGTSVNPARSIGVAFFSGADAIVDLWLFIVAPLLGGAIAGLLYPLVFGRHAEPVPGSGFGAGRAGVPGLGAPNQFEQQWNQQSEAQGQAQPIIQDGWMWDPNAQQWVPAPPEASAGTADPAAGQPDPDDGEPTVVRPQD
ncbi:MIP family channel protein [Nocardioides sp. GY 10113]|uniref:MIP/aquaporin family protein n=1 Tax=Nocardioides sp. GY 10113 TaxID=2569761 RepID=UPI0010A88A11|nr:aquaporin [Nocardioides sp. GY 10113]TIC86806.1 MIP family channel protein [Nocardioides sp. GY 10113]